ncbi:tetratricopeptide repeat protein [Cytophagaceae bacterium ABcell3]|nr:tetratricopeptide repeat protein [Cytophagaceae bacterium ABcell3]
MHHSRINQLLEFLKEDPNDPFTIYALALEYEKTGELDTAGNYFEQLLKEHEDYLGTYYHAGKYYEKTGQITEAKAAFNKGILKARQQNNLKTASELQNALNELLFENDEDF